MYTVNITLGLTLGTLGRYIVTDMKLNLIPNLIGKRALFRACNLNINKNYEVNIVRNVKKL